MPGWLSIYLALPETAIVVCSLLGYSQSIFRLVPKHKDHLTPTKTDVGELVLVVVPWKTIVKAGGSAPTEWSIHFDVLLAFRQRVHLDLPVLSLPARNISDWLVRSTHPHSGEWESITKLDGENAGNMTLFQFTSLLILKERNHPELETASMVRSHILLDMIYLDKMYQSSILDLPGTFDA
ncbi:uncharacterized protein EV420DRAFT_1478638 [Desarmillaria tabescens]|uniref:Uncharacterized protein n=1 Tax=Armillaria tabescens TaxID=1929756 RepID=A0AA39KHK7_ARMTA|nr:uncharacterized protein EV420DRAFT_1478638 [Desarmillaria tabescens]KAK0460106.1 hypothetical protein EV420DRAFT_1478638 [Desarmillaria tabescens]